VANKCRSEICLDASWRADEQVEGYGMTNETSNTSLWDKHANIDPSMTKGITGKDYSGTSPNAHHVIWCLTDLFGPVGQGFGWQVVAESIEHFGDTAIHWCRISFWHTDRANAFEAYGQTKMAYQTKSGFLKVDEDAPKKSLTDAITKAAAQIGVAANIFLGRWDDNKYVADVANEFKQRNAPPVAKVSSEDASTLEDLAARAHSDRAAIFAALKVQGDSWQDLPADLFARVRDGMAEKLAKLDAEHDRATKGE
jgi:hypothetical protein